MKIEFSTEQEEALLDLLVMAMYVDGHLASREDQWIQSVLMQFGVDDEYDRGVRLDLSVARIRGVLDSEDSRAAAVRGRIALFDTDAQREKVAGLLQQLLEGDGNVSARERQWVDSVRESLGVK